MFNMEKRYRNKIIIIISLASDVCPRMAAHTIGQEDPSQRYFSVLAGT